MSADHRPEIPQIFDRALLRRRHQRAVALGAATFLLNHVADDMADRLAAVLRRFDRAADLGSPGTAVRAALGRLVSVGTIVGADLSDWKTGNYEMIHEYMKPIPR